MSRFLRGIGTRAIFFIDYPPLLAYSIDGFLVLPICGLLHALRLSWLNCPISSRPSPRLFDTGSGEMMATGRSGLSVVNCYGGRPAGVLACGEELPTDWYGLGRL